MLEDENCAEVLPVPLVSSVYMRQIIDYCERNIGREIPEIPSPLPDWRLTKCNVSAEDSEFVMAMHYDFAFDMIKAANYLNANDLLKLLCARIASHIKKDPNGKEEETPEAVEEPEEEEMEFDVMGDPPADEPVETDYSDGSED